MNNCKNCQYYKEHYIISNNTLLAIGGHCVNTELNTNRAKQKFKLVEDCKYWELNTKTQKDRQESIKNSLYRIFNILLQIKMIIGLDNEEKNIDSKQK